VVKGGVCNEEIRGEKKKGKKVEKPVICIAACCMGCDVHGQVHTV
jgi:hypothetical protein